MNFVPRSAWGAVAPRATTPFRSKDKIAIHWAGSKLGITDHQQCLGAFKAWQKMHMAPGGLGTKNGANDIAYNAGACEHGYVLEGRGPNSQTGANGTGDLNDHIAALVYIGGTGDDPTPEGWQALRDGIEYLVAGGFRRVGCGHRDLHQTECPGATIYAKIPDLFTAKVPTISEASAMVRNPAVAVKATKSGKGYYILATDGAVFAYGDAVFRGGRGGDQQENAPFVAMELTTTGEGYYLVGADGGVFAYGDAVFFGSPASLALQAPIVAFDATANGYVLIGEDGGVFSYGEIEYVGNARAEITVTPK